MDDVDAANDLTERERAAILATAREKNLITGGSDTCVHCGETIPKARRAAVPHAATCIDCQEGREGGR